MTKWERQLEAMKREYDTRPRPAIKLVRCLDCLKSNWYEWEATRGDETGTVQADYQGELIADETFEAYE